jgi:hypothetical protein
MCTKGKPLFGALSVALSGALILTLLSLGGRAAAQAPADAAGTRAAPRLVLFLSIDQMRYDYVERFAGVFTGGFHTLLTQGALFTNARYRHANCATGPGHAVMLSGRHGSHSGMIANYWYDPYLHRAVNLVEDPVHVPVGGQGRGASPANFLGFTVGDLLKERLPGARVVGVSLKDRSAILLGGRRADAAYWYESAEGRFITSSYYASAAPAWLTRWNAQHYVDRFAGQSWNRLYPDARLYEKYAGQDAGAGEWDGRDILFPHAIHSAPPQQDFYDNFRRTPMADEMTMQFALAAMAAHELGSDETPDILAISFSATDSIGHAYGEGSHEMMDQLLRLDRTLDKLLREIDRRVGLSRTVVVLTADHGSQPLVESLQAQGQSARRLPRKTLDEQFARAFAARFPGVQGLLAYWYPPNFYLDEEVIRSNHLSLDAVTATVAAVLRDSGLTAAVYTQADFSRAAPPGDPYFELFRNSFFAPRSGHVIALMKPYVYLDDQVGGTGHGTPYEYDRHVPLFFLGGGIKPGRYDQPCGPEDIAPTLGRLLGIDYPREPDARLLTEILPPAP